MELFNSPKQNNNLLTNKQLQEKKYFKGTYLSSYRNFLYWARVKFKLFQIN